MSTTPAITAWVPKISADPKPDEIHRLFTLAFQKLGNHATAFGIQQAKINSIKAGTSTTIIEGGSGGGGFITPTTPIGITVNNQSGSASYTTASTDNGVLIVLSNTGPISVSLTPVASPYGFFIVNQGAGAATLTPAANGTSLPTINYPGNPASASMPIVSGASALVAFDGTNWWAELTIPSSGGTITGVNAGTGLTGGGTSGNVTLNLANTAVIPGSYTNTNLTVNAEGQIVSASNGSGGGSGYVKGIISIGPQGGAGTYTASGTVAGATVGSPVLVGIVNSAEAGLFSNLIGYVTAPNTVSIQVTSNAGFLLVGLPVAVFV